MKNTRKRTKKNPSNATSTRSEVRSPTRTSTSTKADTRGNVTVTGGAGRGNTSVTLRRNPRKRKTKRNPVRQVRCYRVYQSSHAANAKNIHMRLADFPVTAKGKKDAIAYARAYHRAYPKTVIGVAKY